MEQVSFMENISLSTIRIESIDVSGNISVGTGFFVRFVDNGNEFVPAIVTNKHVIEGAVEGNLLFTLSKDKKPDFNSHFRYTILDFEKPWIKHPDPSIDLCALPINVFINDLNNKGIKPYITLFELSLLPSGDDIKEMAGLDHIVMIGYPIGLWDAKHNLPVFRSGALASDYGVDWNGKPEFLIDAACVPGSSGSPIMIIDRGYVISNKGHQFGSLRTKLLGVLWGGPLLSANGTITVAPAPTKQQFLTQTGIPINLGYAIKSKELLIFDELFRQELKNNSGATI